MAGEKIKVFELDIDVDAAIKASSKLKSETTGLKAQLDELKESGQENSAEFVKLEAQYKSVRKEYNSSQNELGKLIDLEGKQIKTVEQGRNALSVISKQWAKQADLYGENSVEAEKLMQKKTELTASLKDLESQTGDNTRNVGNYKEGMKGAISEMGIFGQVQETINGVMGGAAPIFDRVKGDLNGVKDNYKAATVGTEGYTVAQKASAIATNLTSGALKLFRAALIATGIGAIVVLIGSIIGALAVMKASLSQTEEGQNKLNKITAIFTGILDGLLKVLTPLANFIFDTVIVAFETLGDIAEGAMLLVADGLAALGFDEAAADVREFNKEMKTASANAQALAKAEAELQTVQRNQEKIQLDYQKRAEKLRQLRDDESRSLAERTQSNQDLAALLKEQGNAELAIARQALAVTELQIKAEGASTAALDRKAEAQLKIAEIQERITSQESEQLANLNSLRKEVFDERAAAAAKATDAAIAESKTRLAIFIEENKGKADSLAESLKYEEQVRDEKISILKEELAAKKLTQSEYELAVIQTKNEFLGKQKDLTVQFANEELEIFKATHQSRIDAQGLLTSALVSEEQRRLDLIAEQEREYQAERLEQGVISQQEYNAAINTINEENRIAKAEQATALKEQEKEAKAIDLENKRAIDAENFLAQLEIEQQQLDMQKQREISHAESIGASTAMIEKKYAAIEKDIEKEKQAYKLRSASSTFANLATILGKESAAGKAAAIASTTIDTYQAATAAYSAMAGIPIVGPALGAIAAATAVAAGLKTVQKITSTKKPNIPKAERGITLSGPSHSNGGIKLYDESGSPVIEAEGGENMYVLNKRASSIANLDALNQATGGIPLTQSTNYAAAGGMIQRTFSTSTTDIQVIDYDLLAAKIGEANRSLPAPQVAITEINDGQGKYADVVSRANMSQW